MRLNITFVKSKMTYKTGMFFSVVDEGRREDPYTTKYQFDVRFAGAPMMAQH